jgi:hypothetical protein
LHKDTERRKRLTLSLDDPNKTTYCSFELSGGNARLGPEVAKGGLKSHMGEKPDLRKRQDDQVHYQDDIYQTYLKSLRRADTVFIEDQYFSAGFSDATKGQVAANTILSALDHTKSAAIILPLSSAAAVPTYRAMVQWKKRQWLKAHNESLTTRGWFNGYKESNILKLDTLTTPHVEFFWLMSANLDETGKNLKLDQKFVHSKALIALGGHLQYPLAVVGSANINDRSLLGTRDAEISVRIEGDGVIDLFAEKIARYLAVSDNWVRSIMQTCKRDMNNHCCQRVRSSFLKDRTNTKAFAQAFDGGVIELLRKRGLDIGAAPEGGGESERDLDGRISKFTKAVGEIEKLHQIEKTTEQFTQILIGLWHKPDMHKMMSSLATLNADLLLAVSAGEVDVYNKAWHKIGKKPWHKSAKDAIIAIFKPPQARRLARSDSNKCFAAPIDALILPFKLGLMRDMSVADLKLRMSKTFSVIEEKSTSSTDFENEVA